MSDTLNSIDNRIHQYSVLRDRLNSIDNSVHQISNWFDLEPISTELKLVISEMNVNIQLIYSGAKLGFSLSPQYFTVNSRRHHRRHLTFFC